MAICPEGHESSDEEYCDTCGARITGASAGGVPAASSAAPAGTSGASGGGDGPCPDCGAPRTGRFCENCGYDFVLGGSGAAPSQAARPAQQAPPTGSSAQPPPWQPAQPAQPWRPAQPGWQPPPPSSSYRTAPPPASAPPPAPAPPPAGGWIAVIAADRAHYDSMIAQGGPDAARVAFPPYCPERRVPLRGPETRIGRRRQSRPMVPEIDLSEPPEDPGVSHLHAVLLAQPDGSWQIVDPGSANGTLVNGKLIEVNVPVPLQDGDRVHVGAWTLLTVRKG
ncbi:FHA domain-containing protein [Sphaerisporangium sp. NPDC051011]|uniref:FHA domain-containing protein n=1 Tax=Sphaerisporangium sp. NPDC051011 TaxID=3155792 RepID=UPI0033CE112E